LKKALDEIYTSTQASLANTKKIEDLDTLRVEILGRKGKLTTLLHNIKDLSIEERSVVGKLANEYKKKLMDLFANRLQSLKRDVWLQSEELKIDPTLPGRPAEIGRAHILNRTLREIEGIFTTMGFQIVEGPEVETDYYNFEAMNFPENHPSRDMHDTFFISEKILLRTHTSPVQVRFMEQTQPPLRAIMPGKTYRCDDDATHSPMFQQVEGLMVDKNISFANLKAVLTLFVKRMFGEELQLRFRPSYFPFTEPSAEIDMSCVKCAGQGCNLCKGTGWIEILGAGMVHPKVLQAGSIDSEKYTGFAFGMGVERITMLKYGIDNMKYFFENDLRFLEQF